MYAPVEYCSTIWHPWQKHLTHRIKMVQMSVAKYVQNDYHYTSSVTSMFRMVYSLATQKTNQSHNATQNTFKKTGPCGSQSSYKYTKQQIPYFPIKNKAPHKLILSADYTTLE